MTIYKKILRIFSRAKDETPRHVCRFNGVHQEWCARVRVRVGTHGSERLRNFWFIVAEIFLSFILNEQDHGVIDLLPCFPVELHRGLTITLGRLQMVLYKIVVYFHFNGTCHVSIIIASFDETPSLKLMCRKCHLFGSVHEKWKKEKLDKQ